MFTGTFVDLKKINRNEFDVVNRYSKELGTDVVLITPNREKHDWKLKHIMFRSLLTLTTGEIISSGMPKFFNYGEKPNLDAKLRKIVKSGKVLFAEKMDGSLIIRTVIGDKIHWRTRGNVELGEDFAEPLMKLISEKYPNALEPTFYNKVSLLFEYTSPLNRIILNYDEPKLTSLGYMSYEAGVPKFCGNKNIVTEISNTLSVDAVEFHEMPNNLEEVLDQVRKWSKKEGVVIWAEMSDGSMLLTKIKCEEYIRLHALRFQMSGDKLRKFCWINKVYTEEELEKQIFNLGADWEFAQHFLPEFNEFVERLTFAQNKSANIANYIIDNKILELSSINLMAKALKEIYTEPMDFNIAIQFCRGNLDYLNKAVGAYAVQCSVAALDNLEVK